MKTKIVLDQMGQPLYVEADAGKKEGKRFRARFSIRKEGSVEMAKKEALNWIDQMNAVKRMDTSGLFRLSQRDQEKCMEAFELLEPYHGKMDIVDAVKRAIDAFERSLPLNRWTFKEAAQHWLEDKTEAKQSAKYLREMEFFFTTAAHYFGKKLCDDITSEDIKKFIRERDSLLKVQQKKLGREEAGLSEYTRNNFKRLFSVLFNYAMKSRHASYNPTLGVVKSKIVVEPAEILSVDDARAFLSACELRFLPYAAAGLFAGIRPDGEAQRMKARFFRLERQEIDLRAAVSKTNERRQIQMMPNFYVWLVPIVHMFDDHLSDSELRGARERAEKASGVSLPRDSFRKSFGSYHYGRFQNLNKSMYMMGHKNPKTFFDYYYASVQELDAIAYFSILPESCKFKDPAVAALYAASTATMPEPKVLSISDVA
jgi:integrase